MSVYFLHSLCFENAFTSIATRAIDAIIENDGVNIEHEKQLIAVADRPNSRMAAFRFFF